MGYFANATEGDMYERKYCDDCVHNHPEWGCPCLEAHALWNYDECNNKDSMLHKMIPREDDGWRNGECIFFRKRNDSTSDVYMDCPECGAAIGLHTFN